MHFNFTQEQQMLADVARRFVLQEYSFETRHKIKQSAVGFDRNIWQGFADLGLLALNVPEAYDGVGGGGVETMLLMSVLGEALVLEPYLSSAVVATHTLLALGNNDQCGQLLPALASGAAIAVLAHEEPKTRYDRMDIETRAWRLGSGYVLNGLKSVLSHGPIADVFFVTARLQEQNGATESLAVFQVPADTPGLHQIAYTTVDGVRACDLNLQQVYAPAEARLDAHTDATAGLQQVLDRAVAAVCAEAVGVLDKLLAATIEYTKNRRQFGSPIAKFQALQHKMADMVLHIEQARSMSYLAAVRCEDTDVKARGAAMSAAKVVIGEACRYVGQQAVQLHGGMGVTDELDVSHYFKRLMAIELQFGSTQYHLEQYAQQLA